MPKEDTIDNYTPYVANDNLGVLFDEKKVYKELIKNGMFQDMANSFFIEASGKEIETKVDLEEENRKLYKIDESEKKFFDEHYFIKDYQETNNKREIDINKELLEENRKLQEEINNMANSVSWKITKPIRDFRTNHKKNK